jgi:hypothetical protein
VTMNLPVARTSEILIQEAGDEILIYDLSINKAFCLNETSALVWQSCDGKNSITDISRLMTEKLKSPVPEEFVCLALDGLKKDNLLEKSDEFEIDYGGLNRREVIRKVGLASMIALPIIASVVAPSALMAQSGGGTFPLFSACTSNSQCASGNCLPITDMNGFVGDSFCCVSGVTANTSGFLGCVVEEDGCFQFNSICCSNIAEDSVTNANLCPPNEFACFCD